MQQDKKDITISFYDSYTPAVKAGLYEIESTLSFKHLEKDSKRIQKFEVRSPQFSIPLGEVHGAFPPNSSVAEYTEVLPSIVLNTKALPWERQAKDKLPWLFLLALREDEIQMDGDEQKLSKTKVERFFDKSSSLKPAIEASILSSDIKESTCISFSIGVSKLRSLLPKNIEDYKYLNHVRQVDISNQADMSYEEPGWFSVVVGNRLLSSDENYTRYYIHLISLEGVLEQIDEKNDDKTIEVISLYRYSCTSQKREGKSFEELIKDVVYKGDKNSSNFLLRKDTDYKNSNIDPKVLDKLKAGYTALNFNLQTGENSFSWYRGPFIPTKLERINKQKNFYTSSNAALIFDEQNGIFDNSYASAWTLGKLLALSNGSFSQKLFDTKKKIHLSMGKLVDIIKENPQYLENLDDLKLYVYENPTQKFLKYISTGVEIKTQVDEENKDKKEDENKLSAHEILEELYKSEKLLEYLEDSEFIKSQKEIIEWFARKKLLYDVPLNYILPNPDYLPSESIRFFYLDDNWIDALISGAFSIGISIKEDIEIFQKLKEYIKPEILEKALALRDELLGQEINELRKDGVSGILLNSSIVSGWKGLEVDGFMGDKKLEIVRMDYLSDNILLCIFDDIPTKVHITEPQQSLCFGMTRVTQKEKEFKRVQLRHMDLDNLGKAIKGGFYPISDGIIDENSVVDMEKLQKELAEKFEKEDLSSSEFALQMVKAPQRVVFEKGGFK